MRFEIGRQELTDTIIEQLRKQNGNEYPTKIYVSNTTFTDDQGQQCEWVHHLLGTSPPSYTTGISLVEEPEYINHLQEQIARRG